LPLAVLTPQVAAGLVVAYLTDGRFKAPKDATVEMMPGDSATKTAESAPAATPTDLPGTMDARRPLPVPVTPQ
jgi:hypothetical protein